MARHQHTQKHDTRQHHTLRRLRTLRRSLDSYRIVLLLILLDYVAVSALAQSAWGNVVTVVLLGATLLFSLRTSGARRIWIALASVFLAASIFVSLVSIAVPDASWLGQLGHKAVIAGGLLLIVTPLQIVRRISAHNVVTTETVLGAVCVYLLLGFSFAFIYSASGLISATAFFTDVTQAKQSDYLFFSYTTLTTVGYGNLVPASSIGQMFSMLEALTGQIYLVIVVARLVSLWGKVRTSQSQPPSSNSPNSGEQDNVRHEEIDATDVPRGERHQAQITVMPAKSAYTLWRLTARRVVS